MAHEQVRKGDDLDVSVQVQNTGSVPADEVAQLYIHQGSGTSSRPIRELKGFQRVALAAGETRTLHFTLSKADLTYWSSATRSWVQDSAAFDVWVGDNSDAVLHGQIHRDAVKPMAPSFRGKHIFTLRRSVEARGGWLTLVAQFPDREPVVLAEIAES